jgi:hypothetical protein
MELATIALGITACTVVIVTGARMLRDVLLGRV